MGDRSENAGISHARWQENDNFWQLNDINNFEGFEPQGDLISSRRAFHNL